MVVLGAAVRLTDSGLSMVDWQPLRGSIPPLNQAQWELAFENYQRYPEFRLVNPNMDMQQFRFIFWMEYAHRLLGRIVGLVYLLPFLFFLLWQSGAATIIAWVVGFIFSRRSTGSTRLVYGQKRSRWQSCGQPLPSFYAFYVGGDYLSRAITRRTLHATAASE